MDAMKAYSYNASFAAARRFPMTAVMGVRIPLFMVKMGRDPAVGSVS